MSATHQCCPVAGCGVRRDNLLKRGGSHRWWYSVDSNRHLLTVCSTRQGLHCHATTTSVPTATSASVASHRQLATCSTSSLPLPTSSFTHERLWLFISRWCCHQCTARTAW